MPRLCAPPLIVVVVVVAAALAALPAAAQDGEPGFGGGGGGEDTTGVPDDDTCVVQGDDGVWRTCAEAIAAKEAARAATTSAPPPRDESAAAQALRKQAAEAEAAAAAATAEVKKTQLEIDLDKAHLDPATMPLLAVRVEQARAQMALDELEGRGLGGQEREAAQERLDAANAVLDAVERIALHRMDFCLQRHGKKPILKNYRMTAGGPVLLTVGEMMRALPIVDPAGCERIILIDDKVIERVKRELELKHILATRSFGYYEVDERKKLERELLDIDAALAKEATPALSAPGVRDPYGRR